MAGNSGFSAGEQLVEDHLVDAVPYCNQDDANHDRFEQQHDVGHVTAGLECRLYDRAGRGIVDIERCHRVRQPSLFGKRTGYSEAFRFRPVVLETLDAFTKREMQIWKAIAVAVFLANEEFDLPSNAFFFALSLSQVADR
ncbi:hypothetical protein JQ609_19765 [Bradyrhizobium sp. AUGA SZCCT0169]|uniref:hypothetical protein n=1 Tax=Bradyrhizobium sp. AUGA SZCCT0169 TaxID=2807663 RepID=UPI001BAA6C6A|nr:hypothetical protein [Bradyrhizobium sp. AUGA SZCCT0169]MBR1249152.1 hypothetical protein [Bradyrhizobium sp. AUGA SZCCT0169]